MMVVFTSNKSSIDPAFYHAHLLCGGKQKFIDTKFLPFHSANQQPVVYVLHATTYATKCLMMSYLCVFQGDARLAVGANSAILKYGTRVSSARVYVAPSVLNEAETAMDAVFGGIHKVILTANTSAAHQCVLPTMAWPGTDVIILDQQVIMSFKKVLRRAKQSIGDHSVGLFFWQKEGPGFQ